MQIFAIEIKINFILETCSNLANRIHPRITSDEQSKQAHEVIDIPKMFHPFINGPGGENQRKIIGELQVIHSLILIFFPNNVMTTLNLIPIVNESVI
jgi:hypothetical protein